MLQIEYLPIDSLLAVHRGKILAVAVQAYYDGSGKSDDPNAQYLTLAGYAGTPNAWRQFEECWSRVLKRWGCQYLHMNEAHSLQGEFVAEKGWTESRVDSLLADLFNECLSPTGWGNLKGEFYGASCTVNLQDYRKACADVPSLKEPEAICVDYVVTIALMALPENRKLPIGKEGTVEIFFDKGESFIHKVDRVWRSKPNSKLRGPLQLVSSIGHADMRDVIGLQAADFLAWHTNRYYTHGMNEKTGSFAGVIRVLASPMFERYYDYEELKGLQEVGR
jgi:hypothetical protein